MRPTNIPILNEQDETPSNEQGFGALKTPAGNLPLKRLEVRSRIAGMIIQTTVRQTFVNSCEEPLEATYIFPLPFDAAVQKFEMRVGNRLIEARLEEREKAREEYVEALEQGLHASLLEEERPNIFTLSVGNLQPGEETSITFQMVAPLSVQDGEATFHFPLVVAPRYIPGLPLNDESVGSGIVPDTDQVQDASRITPPTLLPGFPNPVQLSIEIEIDPQGLNLQNLRSSLHAVSIQEGERYKIELQPEERLDRDFILRYQILDEQIHANVILTSETPDAEEGVFSLYLTGPARLPEGRKPVDVAFVVDRSGSMDGSKIAVARSAVNSLLDVLTEQDNFSLFAFDTVVEAYDQISRSATATHLQAAKEWLSRIDPRGGTEIISALKHAANKFVSAASSSNRLMILLTDGQVGNDFAVLNLLRHMGIRLCIVGIGESLNHSLLEQAAEETQGLYTHVESNDRLNEVIPKLMEQFGMPALSQLKLHSPDVELTDVIPATPLSLFPRQTVMVTGRWKGSSKDARIGIAATDGAGAPWEKRLTGLSTYEPALISIWARKKILQLDREYNDLNRVEKRSFVEQEIVSLSLKYQTLCRFTAFIAIEREAGGDPSKSLRRIIQPVYALESNDRFLVEVQNCVSLPPQIFEQYECSIAPTETIIEEPIEEEVEALLEEAVRLIDERWFETTQVNLSEDQKLSWQNFEERLRDHQKVFTEIMKYRKEFDDENAFSAHLAELKQRVEELLNEAKEFLEQFFFEDQSRTRWW